MQLIFKWTKKLHPQKINNIQSVGGRQNYSDFDQSIQNPIIVPANYIGQCLIWKTHIKNNHVRGHTLQGILRLKYWIPGGLTIINSTINKCIVCRRFQAKLEQTKIAPLTNARVQFLHPFTICGLNFSGPYTYLLWRAAGKPCYTKCWIMHIVYYTTALYLDIVTDLSVEAFLMTFIRFTNTYGKPAKVISDNSSTF